MCKNSKKTLKLSKNRQKCRKTVKNCQKFRKTVEMAKNHQKCRKTLKKTVKNFEKKLKI